MSDAPVIMGQHLSARYRSYKQNSSLQDLDLRLHEIFSCIYEM